jgi:hypothetical protein
MSWECRGEKQKKPSAKNTTNGSITGNNAQLSISKDDIVFGIN